MLLFLGCGGGTTWWSSAAVRLYDAGDNVVVVAAANRAGGRTCSEVRPDGLRVDYGGRFGCLPT